MSRKPVAYLSNLPFEATRNLIEDVFDAEDIEVDNVELITKGAVNKTKPCGLAAVTLKSEADLDKCLNKLDGKAVLGRPMIVRRNKFVEDDPAYQPSKATAK